MSLNTALAGLNAAEAGLNVAGNNLANASTTGFKVSSAEFQDLYQPNAANAPGQGVAQQFIQQDWSQGSVNQTGNPLDLAVQGNGMFVVKKNGAQNYTRDGAFQLSASGQLQTAAGSAVLGYGVNSSGNSNGILGPITVSTAAQAAKPSSSIGLSAALNSADPTVTAAFNATNSSTYDEATSVTAYDSLGNANQVQLYFVKNPSTGSATTNNWSVYAAPKTAAGSAAGAPSLLTTLQFSGSGKLTSGGSANLTVNWNNGAAPSTIGFDFKGTTLGAQTFAINSTTNNGYAPGQYSGTSIATNGDVQATYSNGNKVTVGALALASFINNQGLAPVSDNLYAESPTSGQPVINGVGAGVNGSLATSSLEASNVDTATQLVNLIAYQEQYQANTSVLQGEQQNIQKLISVA